MAPKNLDKLAKLKVPKSPSPPTTPPPNPSDDWDKAFDEAMKTTTTTVPPTTTVPKTPTTTAPKTTGGTGGRKPLTTVREVEELYKAQQRRAGAVGITPQEAEKATEPKKPGGLWGAVAKVINFDIIPDTIPLTRYLPGRGDTNIGVPGPKEFKPIKTVVVPTLGAIQTGGRIVLSANEEAIDRIKQFQGRATKYEATDYIPVHKQTGVPIAKPGDYYIRNWEDIINAPVNIPKDATPEQKVKATSDLVKSKARTSAGSAKELVKAAQDFTYSASDNPYVPQTGNKYVDGVIDFGYDVFLDPATYATLGGSALVAPVEKGAAQAGIKVGSKAGIKAAEREAARVIAEEAAAKAATVAADVTATAAEKAAAKAAADAAEKAAQKAFKQAAAAAPRRVYGRTAREALAQQVQYIRQEALNVIDDAASTAAEKAVAQNAVKVLTDEFIKDVAAKGYSVIRGEAAKTLGVRSGVRIGLPGFGKATIPYTAGLTDFIGSTLAKRRFAFFQSRAGQAILNSITPTGEGGLFGSEAILKMRTALRDGSATPAEAVDYVNLLDADKFYRGWLNVERKNAAAKVASLTAGKNQKILRDISEHLATPEAEWAAKGIRALSAEEQAVYNAVKDTLITFYNEANTTANRLGAGPLTALVDYWPRSQSRDAIEWAVKNGDAADRIASGLGVDRTFFLGNFTNRTLGKGKVWFGQVLDGTESIYDLNKIAKDSGLINFDFFETDPAKALANYAETHAKYQSYGKILDVLTKTEPSAAKGGLVEDLTTKGTVGFVPVSKPGISDLGSLENTVANFMSADRLANWSEAQIIAVRDSIADLKSKLAGSSDIIKREFNDAIMEIDEKIAATTRLINAGIIDPTAGALARAELEAYANDLALSISNVKRDFIVTDPGRWKNVGRVLEDGYVVLNEKTIPNIAVRTDIAEIFKNVKRLDDPAFARAAERVLKDYNTFFKSAVTTTFGFHTRNALSNLFIMIAAGADPVNLTRGLRIYRQWRKALKNGVTIEEFINSGLKSGLIKSGEENIVLQAATLSGATGFGQFGEIISAAGVGRPGFLGKEAKSNRFRIPAVYTPQAEIPGAIPLIGGKKIGGRVPLTGLTPSEIVGTPFYGSRKLGSLIEDFNRFQLTYDGLMQGYDAVTAAARTSKFLIDYNDLSTLDRNIKQIIPFWTWTTRNMPLQIENMWLNPKAYTTYDKFKNNLEDKEGTSPYLPNYLKEAGAFKLPFGTDWYLKPDLGFPGAAGPNMLQLIMEGRGTEILAQLSPALRLPIETAINKKFFTGAAIGTALDQFNYSIQQGVPGLSTIGRILTALPGTEPEIIRTLTGAKADQVQKGITSFVGSPAFKLLDDQQKSEVWRKYFLLKEYIDNVLKKRREERRQG